MKRIVFGGFCMLSGAVAVAMMVWAGTAWAPELPIVLTGMAGFCLALYGFALGLQALGDGTEKQEDD